MIHRTLLVAGAVALAVAPVFAGTLVVSNRGDNTVGFYDTETRELVEAVDAGVGAHELAVSPDGRTALGSCYGSGPRHQVEDRRLVVVDIASRTVRPPITLADDPRPNDLRFLPDGRHALVTSERRNRVVRIDVETGEVAGALEHGRPAGHMMALSPDGARAYVSCVVPGGVVALDVAGDAEPVYVGTAQGAEGIDVSPDGETLWVANNRAGTISVIDTDAMEVTRTLAADGFPFRVRFTPDGERVVVSHPMANEVRVYDARSGATLASVSVPGGPTSLAVCPGGRRVYAVCAGASKVAEIDVVAGRVAHWFETGPIPDGLAVSAVRTDPAE